MNNGTAINKYQHLLSLQKAFMLFSQTKHPLHTLQLKRMSIICL